MLVDLARNDVGRVVTFGTEHVDELMTLERYSHVMHLTSQVSGELADGRGADRRAAGHAAGRHGERGAQGAGDGDHRRARAGQARARTPASSATSTSPATSTPRSPSARCSWRRRRAPACRPAPASWPTRSPTDEDLECRNKARGAARRGSGRTLARPARRRRASVMTPSTDAGRRPRRARAAAVWVDRSDRGFVIVTGPDTFSFLQAWCRRISTRSPTATRCAACCSRRRASSTSTSACCASAPRRRGSTARPGLGAQLADVAHPLPDPGEGRHRSTAPASSGMLVPHRRSRPTTWSRCPSGVHRIDTAWGYDLVGPRRRVPDMVAGVVDPVAFEAWRIEQADPGAAGRHRRHDDPAGGLPRAGRGVVHEGLLHRPGARVPHRQPRPREPLPAPPRRHRGRLAAGRRRDRGRRQGRGRAHERGARPELPTGALGYVRREVEPPSAVELPLGRRTSASRRSSEAGNGHDEAGAARRRWARRGRRRPSPPRARARSRGRGRCRRCGPATVRDV